jgi:hypothetical protein
LVFLPLRAWSQEIDHSKQTSSLRIGALLEGFRTNVPLSLADLDGVKEDGTPITGKATEDPDKNATYDTERMYGGLRGFLAFCPWDTIELSGFLRLGLVSEIFLGKHEESSFFVDTGDRSQGETVSFGNGVLFGLGVKAAFIVDKVRFGLKGEISYDWVTYKNQAWFTSDQTNGGMSVINFNVQAWVGYTMDFITPWAGFGGYVHYATAEFEIVKKNETNHFDAIFSSKIPVVLVLGADFDGGEKVFGSMEIHLLGEYTVQVSLGARF